MTAASPIRDAAAGDLPRIVEIYNAAVPGRRATADTAPVTAAERRAWFERHDPASHPLWVLERGGVVVGWLSLEPFYGRPAYAATAEVSVYIAPEAQRQGVAGRLLGQAVESAPALGLTTLLGFVFAHNEPSVALFGRFGFGVWGRLPDVAELDGVPRTLLILGRHVSGGAS